MISFKKAAGMSYSFIQQADAFIEQERKECYILVMYNMYHPLFSMTFYDLGLIRYSPPFSFLYS